VDTFKASVLPEEKGNKIGDVTYAILEIDGSINVIPKEE
jgi:uncharacterized membrane protein YcaP (DUF421 family)